MGHWGLHQQQWARLVDGIDVQRVALIEIAAAPAMLTAHYVLLII